MDSARKLQFWDLLLECGFKEIEVAFPSASQTDFNFVRQLIDEQRIPEDVTIQVLTQARDPLILRTFEALRGARRATVHLYNATAPLFRELVFGMDKAEVIALATRATRLIRQQCEQQPETRWQYEYSPETFCFTEPEFALEICEAVADLAALRRATDDRQSAGDGWKSTPPTSMPIRSSSSAPLLPPRRGLHQRAPA